MISRLILGILLLTVSLHAHRHRDEHEDEKRHKDHDHRRASLDRASSILAGTIGILEAVRDTAVSGARVVNPVLSTAVGGAKEAAVIATDPRPIFPGTRWCGAGTRAQNNTEIGIFKGTDACCRDHDNCPDNISAGKSKYGLKNNGSFTLSHCDCDEAFHRCLKEDGSLIAKKVGFTYFNVLHPKCFKEERPIMRCAKTTGIGLTKRCQRYDFEPYSKQLLWQWFDALEF